MRASKPSYEILERRNERHRLRIALLELDKAELEARIAELEGECGRLRDIICRWAGHSRDCICLSLPEAGKWGPCDCGWAEVAATLDTTP